MKYRILLLTALLCLTMTACGKDKDPSDSQGNETPDIKTEEKDVKTDEPEESALQTNDDTDSQPVRVDPDDTAPPPDTTVPEDTDPIETDPVDTDPVDTDPVDTDPVDTDDIGTPTEDAPVTGRFVSEEAKYLKLLVDWETVSLTDGTTRVTVKVGISHYRLFSNAKTDLGTITVAGETVHFSTPAIEHDENTYHYTPFVTETFIVDSDVFDIDVSWLVLGNYSGQDVESLTAGGRVTP